MNETDRTSEKVVINMEGKLVKGFIDSRQWSHIEELLVNSGRVFPDVLEVRLENGGGSVSVSTVDAKAIFFVKSFEGRQQRRDLKFHTNAPIFSSLWVQIEFMDGEVVEGIVHNSIRYILDDGIFLTPTDPDGNNRLVYFRKSSIKDFRILGVRNR